MTNCTCNSPNNPDAICESCERHVQHEGDEQTEYTCMWAIEVYADSPEQAAIEAERIARDPDSPSRHWYVEPFGKPEERESVNLFRGP